MELLGKKCEKQNHTVECLPYAFGVAIAGSIHPLFSWIGIDNQHADCDTKTIQEDFRVQQFLSLGAVAYGGKVHKYCNMPMPIDSLWDVILFGVFNVSLQVSNAILLENVWNRIVGHSKKNDKCVAKIIRKLPKSIKTPGRLFIKWSLWRAENYFMFGR